MNLKLYVFLRLFLNEVSVYIEHARKEMMNEGVSMYRSQLYGLWWLCEKYTHMYSHTHLECRNEVY